MSIPQDDCYGNIIGISRNPCSCDTIPSYANTSDSGLWLDELLNREMFNAAQSCYTGDIWTLAQKSIHNGLQDTITHLMGCIQGQTKLRRKQFSGMIGDMKKQDAYIDALNTYHGLKMAVADVQAGYLKIKRIGAYFNQTGTLDIDIYNGYDDSIIQTETVNTVADRLEWTTLSTPLILDLNNEYGSGFQEYFFLYQPSGGLKPRNIKIKCPTCGGIYTPTYNLQYPQFNQLGDKGNFLWSNWAMAAGTKGNSLSTKDTWGSLNETQGLMLDMEFGCDVRKTICNGTLDYTQNPWSMALAAAVQYRSAVHLLRGIDMTPNINYESLLNGEVRADLIKEYTKLWERHVFEYLCPQISSEENINQLSDCLTCDDQYGMVKAGIFA
jgi:hypothetical protein